MDTIAQCKKIKVASLFSGIGGIDLGLLQAGYEIVWANEIEKSAADTYKYNLGGNSIVVGDIKNIEANEIPDFDVLAAGFPCQSFSTAGKQRGFDDSRGNLFFQVARVAAAKKPPSSPTRSSPKKRPTRLSPSCAATCRTPGSTGR